MKRITPAFFLILLPALVSARTILNYQGHEKSDDSTAYHHFELLLRENGSRMIMDLDGHLEQGELNVWLGGAGYQVIGDYTGTRDFRYDHVVFGPLNNQDSIIVKITSRNASGTWRIRLQEVSKNSLVMSSLFAGCLVVLMTGAIALLSRKYLQIAWKWLLVGAGAWFVGVVFKFVAAYFANTPVLTTLRNLLGNSGYLVLGSTYIGLLTGVFEIGITLVFALLIRHMWENSRNALGVGLGAGLIEALLIGFSSLGSFVMVMTNAPGSDAITGALTQTAAVTPLLWLISPIERLIAILCHTSSRMLVLFAMAQRRMRYFWLGFAILTAIDAIAGYFHLAGLVNSISTWWIELLLLPFAVISYFVIRWCITKWQVTAAQPSDRAL
jgi:uncharacterized membrane protein YhfC